MRSVEPERIAVPVGPGDLPKMRARLLWLAHNNVEVLAELVYEGFPAEARIGRITKQVPWMSPAIWRVWQYDLPTVVGEQQLRDTGEQFAAFADALAFLLERPPHGPELFHRRALAEFR